MANLKQIVHANNELQKLAEEQIKHLTPQLEQLIGKKVVKQDNGATELFKNRVELKDVRLDPPPEGRIEIHRCMITFKQGFIGDAAPGNMWLSLSVRVSEPEHSFYRDIKIFLATTEHGVLDKVSPAFKPQYTTVEEQQFIMDRLNELKFEQRELKSKCIVDSENAF